VGVTFIDINIIQPNICIIKSYSMVNLIKQIWYHRCCCSFNNRLNVNVYCFITFPNARNCYVNM
jgi:hypothetical protein